MELAKAYWLLNNNINQKKADYYKYSDKSPYERGIDALDYFRYYGGKPLNIEKTYYNRLLMPIFDDLDLFQLKITKILLKMKEFQDDFQMDETTKELLNLTKIVPISVKEIIKNKKSIFKDIVSEFKNTKNDTNLILKEGMEQRKIMKPFLQFMEHRELDDQDMMNKIRKQFKSNCERILKFRENMMIEENLKEIRESEKHEERFNDYLIDFKKNLENKNRRMKLERLKMKNNDLQLNLEDDMLKKKEIPKIKRKIISLGFYKYNPNSQVNENEDNKPFFDIPQYQSSSINKSISSFSRYIKDKISEEI